MDFRVISPERQRTWGTYPLHGHHWIMTVSGAVDSCARDRACLSPEQSFLQMGAGVHSEKASAHRGKCQGMWAQPRQCLQYYMTSILSYISIFSMSLLPDKLFCFTCLPLTMRLFCVPEALCYLAQLARVVANSLTTYVH